MQHKSRHVSTESRLHVPYVVPSEGLDFPRFPKVTPPRDTLANTLQPTFNPASQTMMINKVTERHYI